MAQIIAFKLSFNESNNVIFFTTDIEGLNNLYVSNEEKDNRDFINLKKGDIINYPNSNNEYLKYIILELLIAYNPNLNPEMFKYGIPLGQAGSLEPYHLCIHLTLKQI